MLTFNGDASLKKLCLERVTTLEHRLRKDNEERKLLYWSRHQACDPYCKIGDCSHAFYSEELGIPAQLAYAEREIFLALDLSQAGGWPRKFVTALPIGIDLSSVWQSFALETLSHTERGIINFARNREENDAIVRCIELLEKNCNEEALWDTVIQRAEAAANSRSSYPKDMSKDEALTVSGIRAAETVLNFARSFRDARYSGTVIDHAAETVRCKGYAADIATVAFERNSEFDSFWRRDEARARWKRNSDSCLLTASHNRNQEIVRLSNEILKHIQALSPSKGWKDVLLGLFR